MKQEKIVNISLITGVIIGISIAIFSSIQDTNFDFSDDWVAKVGDVKISRSKYLLQLQGLSNDKMTPLTEIDKSFVLERMIEEELLIQRARELGMFSANTIIRGTIVQQMINMIISENSLKIIDPDDLKKFYNQNKGFFTSADRLRLRQIFFSDKKQNSYERASEVYLELVKGLDIGELMLKADKTALQIPDTLMTLSKIREYVGPSLMQLAKKLEPGQFTSPKKVPGGYKIIFLVERRDAQPPNFSQVKDRVKSEYLKRSDDQALRDYLDSLKNWYEIERRSEI